MKHFPRSVARRLKGNPSDEGHPGQAPNCRCRAVPVLAGSSEVILADFALPADGFGNLPDFALRRILQQLVARTPEGAAVLTAMGTATPALNR